jgi:hypothetical protein
MPLSAGDKLGHYEVVSLLGQGGMGEELAVNSASNAEREMRGGGIIPDPAGSDIAAPGRVSTP